MKEYIAIYRREKTQIFYSFEAMSDEGAWHIADFVGRTNFKETYLYKVVCESSLMEMLKFINSLDGIEEA